MKKNIHNLVFLLAIVMTFFGVASLYSATVQKKLRASLEKETRFTTRTIRESEYFSAASDGGKTARIVCEASPYCGNVETERLHL